MVNESVANNVSGCSTQLLSAMIIFDGVSALLISFLYYLRIQMTDYFSDYQTVGVMMEQQANFALSLALGYLVSCVICVLYAQKRKHFGMIVFACLAAIHTIGVVLLRMVNGQFLVTDFLKPVVYFSILYNLLLLFLIFMTSRSTTMKTG